jgi:hypothetical protein
MKYLLVILYAVFLQVIIAFGAEPTAFDTQWIPAKPEVMTYNSTDSQGTGLYQVSICKKDSAFEIYINIISTGFTKTVSGTFNSAMRPLQSTAKIIVDGQIMMDTKCSYTSAELSISTLMSPYNQTMAQNLAFDQSVIDFSQVPILVRTLQLAKDRQYAFTLLDPKTNTLVPLTLKVTGEGTAQEVRCYKVEINDFEGQAIYWVEKDAHHRVMRVEQPESHRTIELLP